ncbi:hypothetical protein C4D60_Mb09t18140 [Musa balbisiana]|uniref:Uncharacterized protein n=1 Tax=Musa balbisiana TaxID=52838 RepID=A0A4S8IH89_MUSBA|nr:hypothetical protein C4D60_Mb09t18140 [Musa balbisiana]
MAVEGQRDAKNAALIPSVRTLADSKLGVDLFRGSASWNSIGVPSFSDSQLFYSLQFSSSLKKTAATPLLPKPQPRPCFRPAHPPPLLSGQQPPPLPPSHQRLVLHSRCCFLADRPPPPLPPRPVTASPRFPISLEREGPPAPFPSQRTTPSLLTPSPTLP